MRTIISLSTFLCLFILTLLPNTPPAEALSRPPRQIIEQPDSDISRLEMLIHNRINLERKKAGLPALGWNQKLHGIARDYSRDMATRNFFSHYNPEGQSFTDRYRQAGFKCAVRTGLRTLSLGGENIAWNHQYKIAAQKNGKSFSQWQAEEQLAIAVVNQWMASESHRRNILSRNYRQEGIGAYITQDGTVFVTENFC